MMILQLLFKPNGLVCSPRVQAKLSLSEWLVAVEQHLHGNWGEVSDDQRHQNNTNVLLGSGCLVSIFKRPTGELFWVVTEGSWQQTAVLFPEEFAEWDCFHTAEQSRDKAHPKTLQ